MTIDKNEGKGFIERLTPCTINDELTKRDILTATVTCNEIAMKYWALKYGGYAEILDLKSLRNSVRKAVKYVGKVYR